MDSTSDGSGPHGSDGFDSVGRLPTRSASTPNGQHDRLCAAGRTLVAVGGAMSALFAILPAIGFALVLISLSNADPHPEHRGEAWPIALSLIAVAVAYVAAIVRSFRRGWIALAVVGVGGLALAWTGFGMAAGAVYVDAYLVWALVIGGTGLTLALGAVLLALSRSLGHVSRSAGHARHHGYGTRERPPTTGEPSDGPSAVTARPLRRSSIPVSTPTPTSTEDRRR